MMGAASVSSRYGERVGERVGSLVFEGIASSRDADGRRVVGAFRCDCGNTIEYPLGRVLTSRRRTHCGCKTDRGAHRRHGMRYTAEYAAWQGAKWRCLDPNNRSYPDWGGKGITFHPEWIDSFEAFFAHIGPRPPGTSLDRINTLKGYEPGNVRWADSKTQATNRTDSWTVIINGEQFASVADAAARHGVSSTTIVRWCDGYVDPRRGNQETRGARPPKPGCWRWRTYAKDH